MRASMTTRMIDCCTPDGERLGLHMIPRVATRDKIPLELFLNSRDDGLLLYSGSYSQRNIW